MQLETHSCLYLCLQFFFGVINGPPVLCAIIFSCVFYWFYFVFSSDICFYKNRKFLLWKWMLILLRELFVFWYKMEIRQWCQNEQKILHFCSMKHYFITKAINNFPRISLPFQSKNVRNSNLISFFYFHLACHKR